MFISRSDNEEIELKQLFGSYFLGQFFLSFFPRIVKPVCFFLSNDLSKVGSRVLSSYSALSN